MIPGGITALTFDTGGTILDWHTGIHTALQNLGTKYGLKKDWTAITNEFRRRALKGILNHGEHGPATQNFDDVHRATLDQLAADMGLQMLTLEDRRTIWWDTIHNLQCWPDFPAVLPKLREKYYCVSFTLLSFRIIMDTAKRNGLSWDAVMSCEGIGKYKLLPEAYLTCAKFLQFEPSQCLMVACHNFDLDAARACGYKTAFVYRPDEWGAQGPPDPEPRPYFDIIARDFPDLARQLGVSA
jgi:2-haloacid dehalogenase